MKYVAWETYPNLDPIPNTEKIYEGPNRNHILKHIAYEHNVKLKPLCTNVELLNGNKIFVFRV